jgi:hypothetical protein
MLMKSQNLIEPNDIQRVIVGCQSCNVTVTVDMKERSLPADKYGFFAPKKCPGCGAEYDSVIVSTVDSLQKLYAGLLSKADYIRFVAAP